MGRDAEVFKRLTLFHMKQTDQTERVCKCDTWEEFVCETRKLKNLAANYIFAWPSKIWC